MTAFIKKCYKRSDISMLELTPDFIKEYEIYLSTDAGLHNGSVWSHCMWLKTIVFKAYYNGLTPRNPFAQYRVNQNIKERQYLTEDEIKAVMTHEFADKKLAYIRDLFVFASFTAPTLRAAIKAMYKSGTLNPATTQRCDLATPTSWATFYNLEVVITLVFRLNTYEASRIRQNVLECLCQRKENRVNLFISLGSNYTIGYN